MAFDTYTAKMAPLNLYPNYFVRFEAIRTDTGVALTNVVISNATLYGVDLSGAAGGADGQLGPFMLVPGPGA